MNQHLQLWFTWHVLHLQHVKNVSSSRRWTYDFNEYTISASRYIWFWINIQNALVMWFDLCHGSDCLCLVLILAGVLGRSLKTFVWFKTLPHREIGRDCSYLIRTMYYAMWSSIMHKLVTTKPNMRTFLQSVSGIAHVWVWTCMGHNIAAPIVSWLFGELKHAFLLLQKHCTTLKQAVKRKMFQAEAWSHEEFFKELYLFWKLEWGINLEVLFLQRRIHCL